MTDNDSTKSRNERYRMEYVNCEVSIIIDTEDNHELTAEELTDRLNRLTKESNNHRHNKALLNSMIMAERTELGRSVLKQFKEAIQ